MSLGTLGWDSGFAQGLGSGVLGFKGAGFTAEGLI